MNELDLLRQIVALIVKVPEGRRRRGGYLWMVSDWPKFNKLMEELRDESEDHG